MPTPPRLSGVEIIFDGQTPVSGFVARFLERGQKDPERTD
ncbi:hypothetical protein CSIRO_1843 [Bradyrhizobiaceae bacterium SG-6C]|nr:hypothetical protein CSIRO_1843 [Bradyrhizobiaceae bacterium SG-6C]